MAVELIAKIKPKNNGNFPLVDAEDISIDEKDKRLSELLAEFANISFSNGKDGASIFEIPNVDAIYNLQTRLENGEFASDYAFGIVTKAIGNVAEGSLLKITAQGGQDVLFSLKGTDGKDGTNGTDGKDGADGKTPVKGEDYFTEEDKAELVSDVLAALPAWEGGSY